LVMDDPHVRITEEPADYAASDRDIHGILGGDDATTLAVRLFWEQERSNNDPANGSRWSELHPPDLVDVQPSRPRTEVLRSVLVATPPDLAPMAVFTFDVNLPLPQPAVSGATPRVVEAIGPESRPRSLRGKSGGTARESGHHHTVGCPTPHRCRSARNDDDSISFPSRPSHLLLNAPSSDAHHTLATTVHTK
jgi:hypothetical protein